MNNFIENAWAFEEMEKAGCFPDGKLDDAKITDFISERLYVYLKIFQSHCMTKEDPVASWRGGRDALENLFRQIEKSLQDYVDGKQGPTNA